MPYPSVERFSQYHVARDNQIRDLAYQLWEKAGCPEGRSDEFWYAAEKQLMREDYERQPLQRRSA